VKGATGITTATRLGRWESLSEVAGARQRRLIRWLLDNDLVDEMNLLIVPVVLGQGTRLFPDAGPDIALDLVDSRADSKGVTIQVYRPTGRLRYATDTADHDDE
jgi:RibD C-terminal domain